MQIHPSCGRCECSVGLRRGIFALRRENPIHVAVKWDRLPSLSSAIAFGDCFCDQRSDGAVRFTRRSGPVQSVVRPFVAENLLRVLRDTGALARLRGIFVLRLDQALQNVDRVQLVGADPPEDQFLLAGRRIEHPLIIFFDQRNWQRPVVRADI
jgi:hypothetical protein